MSTNSQYVCSAVHELIANTFGGFICHTRTTPPCMIKKMHSNADPSTNNMAFATNKLFSCVIAFQNVQKCCTEKLQYT